MADIATTAIPAASSAALTDEAILNVGGHTRRATLQALKTTLGVAAAEAAAATAQTTAATAVAAAATAQTAAVSAQSTASSATSAAGAAQGTANAAAAAAAAASQPGHVHADATTSTPGHMSAADKAKLNGIEAGATADMTPAEIVAAVNTNLGGPAWQDSGTATIPALTTDAGTRTAAENNAFLAAVGIQSAAGAISASRALATTDSNTEAIVSNGVALTLDSGSLTDGTPFGGTAATGATFTLVVGTAAMKLYHGGPALAGGTVISSARSQAGKITIERKGTDYILLEPVLSVPAATITTSGALPARTVEDKQHVIVSVAGGAVALDCSGATGWAAGDLARGMFFRVIGGGAAKLSFTGGNVVNPASKTFGSGEICALVGDPTTANTVWVVG